MSGGFKTRVSSTSSVGTYFCGGTNFGTRRPRTAYQDVAFTLRLSRSGELACWSDHSLKSQGLPMSSPDVRVKTTLTGANDDTSLTSMMLYKNAPWAEGGGVADDMHMILKSTHTQGSRGLVCCDEGSSCNSCPGSATCTECKESKHLYNGTCVSACPAGYRSAGDAWSSLGRRCVECAAAHCSDCSGSTECTRCKDGKYLVPSTGECVDACSAGYYEVGSGTEGRECSKCEDGCVSCFDGSTCEECDGHKILHDGDCVGICPVGTFEEGDVGVSGRECVDAVIGSGGWKRR